MNTWEEAHPESPGRFDAPADVTPSVRHDLPVGLIGLVGVVVAFVAIASLFALQQPPFIGADEKAHLGYAHVVANGSMPTIDQRLPVPGWAEQWESETIYTHIDRNRTVWVANHPPLFYMATSPVIWLSEATQRPDGGLLFLRFANIAFGAVGLVFTYALAIELTRSSRLALLSAAAAAMMTQLHAALSLGMSDGLTFAAGAAVTWAGVRCLQRGVTGRNLAMLSAATAVAVGARAVTMLIAGTVVLMVAAFEFVRKSPIATGDSGDRWRSAARVCTIAFAPAVLLFGWFYVRNIVLYGDIGASSYLLERFDREANGSVLSTLFNDGLWRSLFFRTMSPVTYRGPRPPLMLLVAALALGGLVGVFLTRRTGDRDAHGERHPVARRSILLLLIGVAVIVWYIAQHVSGGGYLHPRYAFPVVGSVAVLLILGLDRIAPRILPAAVIVGMGVWTLSQLPVGVDVSQISRPRDEGRLAPAALRTLPGDEFWRLLAGAGIVLGCTIAVVALIAVLAVPRLDRTSSPSV